MFKLCEPLDFNNEVGSYFLCCDTVVGTPGSQKKNS